MKIDDIDKIDTQKIYEIYDKWPEIARESFVKQIKKFDVQDIDHIVFAGMGGSGSIGDVIGAILSKEDVHVSNVKGYVLPKTVDSKTLIVTTSVSGNTRETMTVLEKAKNSSAKIAAFSSGGMIKEYCQLFPRTCYLNETFLKEKVHVCREIVRTNNDLNSFFSSKLKMNEIDEDIPYMYIEWQEVIEDVLKMIHENITIQQKTEIIKFLHELVYEIFDINYTDYEQLHEFVEYGYSTWLDLVEYLKPGSFSTGITRARFGILLYNFGIKLKNKGYSIELIENVKQSLISLLKVYDI